MGERERKRKKYIYLKRKMDRKMIDRGKGERWGRKQERKTEIKRKMYTFLHERQIERKPLNERRSTHPLSVAAALHLY